MRAIRVFPSSRLAVSVRSPISTYSGLSFSETFQRDFIYVVDVISLVIELRAQSVVKSERKPHIATATIASSITSQRLSRHSFLSESKISFMIQSFLPEIASAGLIFDARHAGIPVLMTLSRRQNSSAIPKVLKFRSMLIVGVEAAMSLLPNFPP